MSRPPLPPTRVACALVFAAFLSPALPRTSHAADPSSIAWQTDLPRARAVAASRDRLIWLQFSGPWCAQCRKMDGAAFLHTAVVAHSASTQAKARPSTSMRGCAAASDAKACVANVSEL